jgi:hypothetical protein
MNHLQIPEAGIDVFYPSEYEEMTSEQAIDIGKILFMTYTGICDYDMARKMAVDIFLNRVNGQNKPKLTDESLNYWANEGILADSVNFLFQITPEISGKTGFIINPKFCKQLIDTVKLNGKIYYGAKDLISDLTIMEYKEATWRVVKFSETKEEHWLNELCAVLYALRSGEGETARRAEYSNERMLSGAKDFEDAPVGLKFMTWLFFTGCLNWIREEAIEIDGTELDFGCLFRSDTGEHTNTARQFDDTGMTGVLFQMAESGVFGNMEQTCRINVWDIFLRLYQIHMQNKSLKR